jgi:hypothetical protein
VISSLFEDSDFKVLGQLFTFVEVPEEIQLNSTLCGYFNKIISFWLIKKPELMIDYFGNNPQHMTNLLEHIYLNSSIIDLVIRICCIQGLPSSYQDKLQIIRCDFLSGIINKLEHYEDDTFMTEQIFGILSGLLKKCYIMSDPKEFFEEMLSPFVLKPILDYTFQV